MDRLIEALKNNGFEVSREQATQIVLDAGFEPDNLSDADIDLIVSDYKSRSGAITKQSPHSSSSVKSTGGKPAKGKKTRDAKNSSEKIDQSIQVTAQHSAAEIDAFLDQLDAGVTKYSATQAENAINIIRSAPQRMLDKFVDLADEEGTDPKKFRGYADQAIASVFGSEFCSQQE